MKLLSPSSALITVKFLHTVAWSLLAGCILALPVVALINRMEWAAVLTVVVLGESGVIGLNHGRCPLTNAAARYIDNRAENFDIYLPLWLTRHNKTIFGTLFIAGELVLVLRWMS